jgi:excinuclease ABC subunit C
VCIGRGPAAHAYLSIKPSIAANQIFGPVPAGRQYRRGVRRLNDCFGLRDCRRPSEVLFSDQLELFSEEHESKCIRGAVGTCLAPCATACSRAEYDDRLEAAVEFLSGRDVTVLQRIEKEMKVTAEGQQFELAARLRDAHEDLGRLSASLQRLREARHHTFVYPVRGLVGRKNWYLIREGQIMGVERAPHTGRASARCLKALDVVFPQDGCLPLPVAAERLDMALLLARWFREHPEESAAVLSAEEARDLCNSRSGG